MGHTFTISDERYQQLEHIAAGLGTTPEQLFAAWLEEMVHEPRAYETDEWFRHLGMSEDEIEESKRLAKELHSADAR